MAVRCLSFGEADGQAAFLRLDAAPLLLRVLRHGPSGAREQAAFALWNLNELGRDELSALGLRAAMGSYLASPGAGPLPLRRPLAAPARAALHTSPSPRPPVSVCAPPPPRTQMSPRRPGFSWRVSSRTWTPRRRR